LIHTPFSSDKGQLKLADDTLTFPWASRRSGGSQAQGRGAGISERSDIDETVLTGSSLDQRIADLKAVNSIKSREILYQDVQNNDGEKSETGNAMKIGISGYDGARPDDSGDPGGDDIEALVDEKLNSCMGDGCVNSRRSSQHLGNDMDIDVSGITVSAINTVAGGSAVATSNIIIKPVQIIVSPSEVEERLK